MVAEVLEQRKLLSSTVPLTDVPVLDSRPNASVKVYLDFVGTAATTWDGESVPALSAFDVDGDPTTFSTQELADIQRIWSIAAEAYSPFNVDVTTVDPYPGVQNYPVNEAMRIVVTNTDWFESSNYAGISVDGSFSVSYQPRTSYVFATLLGRKHQLDWLRLCPRSRP